MDSSEASSTLYPNAILVPVFAGISALMCVPAVIVNVRARNVPASVLTISILTLNIRHFINALMWPTDDIDSWWSGVGFCDIDIKIQAGLVVAIIGAILCIFRQLSRILNIDKVSVTPSRNQILRKQALDVLFCLIIPIYLMIAQYFFQPERFSIYAISGCAPPIGLTWPTVVFYFIWQPLICTLATGYCVVAVWRLLRYRRQVSSILASAQSKVSKSRFTRLFAMSVTLIVVYLPLSGYALYLNLVGPWYTYSFRRLHLAYWSQLIVRVPTHGWVPVWEWVEIATGFVSFLLFGTSVEALKMYGEWARMLRLDRLRERLRNSRTRRSASHVPLASATAVSDDNTFRNENIPSQQRMSSSIRSPTSSRFDDMELGKIRKVAV